MLDNKGIRAEIARLLQRPAELVDDKTILTALVADSLELAELVIQLEEWFGVQLTQDDLREMKTVGDLERVLEGKTRG